VCDDYAKKGLFPFIGTIESVTFAFGAHNEPTGMERLKLATRMD
jgi:arylsulfatase